MASAGEFGGFADVFAWRLEIGEGREGGWGGRNEWEDGWRGVRTGLEGVEDQKGGSARTNDEAISVW